MKSFIAAILIALTLSSVVTTAYAHSGRTASDGCHNDRKNGGRHCH